MAKANSSKSGRNAAPKAGSGTAEVRDQSTAWLLNPLVGDTVEQTMENIHDFSMFMSIVDTGSESEGLEDLPDIEEETAPSSEKAVQS